jgi:amicoumacin kinase
MTPVPLETEVLSAAAAAFGAAARNCRPVRGGNFSHVFAFSRPGQECILRITPPDEGVDAAALLAALDYSDYLAQGGVSVPAPLRSLRGTWIEAIPSQNGAYLAAAFERAPGVLAEELPFSVWDAGRFTLLGSAVGRFHARSRSYQPGPGRSRPHWDEALNCFHPSEEIAEEELRRRRLEALEAVQVLPRDPAGYGWIHADLHGGNFMLDLSSGRITLLDFDDIVLGWYAMDIAMLLHDFCVLTPETDKDTFAAGFLGAFLRGYLSEFPLEPAWIERLPLFLKLLETGIYAQVAPFADSEEPNSWVGRFMFGRRQRIASGAPVVNIDFAHIPG